MLKTSATQPLSIESACAMRAFRIFGDFKARRWKGGIRHCVHYLLGNVTVKVVGK
jgi:hypothetical protein